jgi:hypothetical protein
MMSDDEPAAAVYVHALMQKICTWTGFGSHLTLGADALQYIHTQVVTVEIDRLPLMM